mgnify:CR=1 FL=1
MPLPAAPLVPAVVDMPPAPLLLLPAVDIGVVVGWSLTVQLTAAIPAHSAHEAKISQRNPAVIFVSMICGNSSTWRLLGQGFEFSRGVRARKICKEKEAFPTSAAQRPGRTRVQVSQRGHTSRCAVGTTKTPQIPRSETLERIVLKGW